MDFEEIWGQLLYKEPKLGNADYQVTIKSANLKKLLMQVYDKGVASRNTKAVDKFFDTLMNNICKE